MHQLQSEQIFGLGEISFVREPEIFVYAAQNQNPPPSDTARDLCQGSAGDPCRHGVRKIIVGAGVGGAAAIVIEIVARPNRCVGFVQALIRAQIRGGTSGVPNRDGVRCTGHISCA